MIGFLGSFWAFTLLNSLVLASSLLWSTRGFTCTTDSILDRALSVWVLFIAQVTLSEIALGVVGVLSLEGLYLFHGIVLGTSYFYLRLRQPNSLVSTRWSWTPLSQVWDGLGKFYLLAILFLLVIFLVFSLNSPPTDWDSLAYHLPFAVTWLQTGRLDVPYFPLIEGANNYFASNFELLLLWVMYPFRSDLLVKFVSFSFLPMAILGLYGVCRRFRADVSASVLAVALFVGAPVVLGLSNVTSVDLAVAALFLVSLRFILTYGDSGDRSQLAVGAIASGLMAGCKATGIQFWFALLVLVVVLCLGRFRLGGWRRTISDLLAFCLLGALFGSYWYLRNLIITGTPLYPVSIKLFGLAVFDGPVGLNEFYGYTILLGHLGTVFGDFLGALTQEYGIQWILLLTASLAAPVVWWHVWCEGKTCANTAVRSARLYLLLLFVPMWLLYLKTPYSISRFSPETEIAVQNLAANLRFAIPIVALSCVALAFVVSRSGRFRNMFESLALMCILQNFSMLLVLDIWHTRTAYVPQDSHLFVAQVAVWTAVAIIAVQAGYGVLNAYGRGAVLRMWRNMWHRLEWRPARRFAAILLLCCLWLGVGIGVYALHCHREEARYDYYQSAHGEDLASAWHWIDETVSGRRIAYEGDNRIYPLYGTNCDNIVLYVNKDGCDDCKWHDYFGRTIHPNYDSWRSSLARQEVDYFFLRGGVPWNGEDFNRPGSIGFLSLVFRNRQIRIYRVTPGSCQMVMAEFGELVRLVGYEVPQEAASGSSLKFTLHWQRIGEMERQYSVFSHLIDEEWKMWGQSDGVPQVEPRPAGDWGGGEIIEDRRTIEVPADAPEGRYRLEIGVYALETMERLTLTGARDGELDDRVLTGPIPIHRSF